MKITKTDGPPKKILTFDTLDVDNELNLTPSHVEDVVEIFNTPLTGAYNWDYTVADNRIKKLYELGKELNWNGSIDLNWDYTHPANERLVQADEELPHETLEAYENLSEEEKIIGRPKFISILKTKKGDTPLLLSKRMALDKNQLEIFLIMNGLTLESNDQIAEGTLIKMIIN